MRAVGILVTALVPVMTAPVALSASFYWDNDATAAGNATTGAGLGGTGTWDIATSNWWDGVSVDQAWPNSTDTAIFTGTAGAVTLGAPISAGGLTFNSSGYSILGGGNVLTLAAPTGSSSSVIAVNGIGFRDTIAAQVSGSSQIVKNGDGTLVLSNTSNNFNGNVLVNQGALVITDPLQLGSASLISVNGSNQINNTGGSLVLQGGLAGLTFAKNLSLNGRGLNYANTTYASLANIGQNTISGNIAFGNASTSGIGNAYGNLTLSGTIGLSSSQNSFFGLGNGNTIITGQVTGSAVSTDRFIKTQSNLGTSLWLTNTANNFVSDLRIDSGTVRVTSNAVLGLSTSSTAVDLNNGTLEVLTDAPDFSTRNVRTRDNAAGTIFVSRGLGGTGLNQTVTFGTMTGANINATFNMTGRDGYNITIGGGVNLASGGNGNLTFNSSGNGTLTLNAPSLWNNTDTSGSRTLTIQGNAESVVTGTINAAPGSSDHNLTKAGQGTVTLQTTSSNFRGAANVNAGTLSIGTFGAINNNATPGSGALQLNTGALSFTGAATTGAGETVSKAVNLTGTTGLGAILANQTGTSPSALIITNSISATGAGSKTLFLGGSASSSIVNQINGVIQSNSGTNTTSLTKIGSATWLYSPSVASYGTVPSGVTVTAGGAAQTNSFTVSSATGLAVGQAVTGTNVPASSVITNINGSVITINNNIGTAIAAATALTFTANSNFTGNITVGGGTLRVAPTAATSSGSNLFVTTQGLTFGADNLTNNGSAGGTFQLATPTATLTANLTQTLGALTPSAGAGRVQVDAGNSTFSNILNFASMGTRVAGASVNFAPAASLAGIQFAALPTGLNGQLGGFATITSSTGAVDFVATPTLVNTNIAALGASTLLPGSGATSTTNYIVNAAVTTTAAEAANTIRITGGNSLNLSGGALTITSTSATAIGGILHDNAGGASTISGTNIFVSTANGELIVNSSGTTNANTLTISSVITGNNTATAGTGGLTKAGGGTLVLSGANTYTGTTIINEGMVQLSGSGTLGGTNASLLLRQGTTLDLNGVNVGTSITSNGLNNFSGAGTITNSAASGTAFIRVGNNGGGGTFSGVIQDGATAKTQFVKGGAGTVSLSGINTFTGGVIITGGTLAINSMTNFGTAGSLGAGITGNNAGSLVFNGGGTLQYTGSNANIYQTTQTPSVTTDRLFTIDGTGAVTATIDSSGQYGNNTTATGAQNNAALVFGNTGAVAFAGTGARTVQLTGNSTGDNEFKPVITDKTAVTELTGLTKAGAGLWIVSGTNTYSGPTTITAGALQAVDGTGIPTTSNLALNGGVFQTTGTFTRAVGTAAGQVQWTAAGGFSAGASKLSVNLGGAGATFTFGATAPVNTSTLILSSTTAQSDVTFTNPIDLNAGARTIQVDDNTQSNFDFATASGVISGAAGSSLTKTGSGTLILGGSNTYLGATTVSTGNLIVQSIGASGATATSIGTNVGGGALNIGSTTNAGAVFYVGTGETTTRLVNIAGTTGGATIDSSGSGPLNLTNVAVSGAGIKTLTIRGFNTDANSITSNLNDNGGALSVTKADAGVWELSGTNGFTGNLTIGGLLGANSAAALGAAGTGSIIFNNGGLYTNTAGGFTIARATQIASNTQATFVGSNQFTLTNTMTGATGNPWTINNDVTGATGLTISGNFNSAEAATQARTLAIQGIGNTILSGVIQGTGGGVGLIINTLPTATTTLTGASANLMSSGGELRSGILILDKAQALGLSSTTFDLNGGELRTSSTVAAQTQANAFRLNGSTGLINGSNPLTMSGSLAAIGGNRTLENDITSPSGLTISGLLNLSADTNARTFTLCGSGITNVTNLIANGSGATASNFIYLGSGALNLSGAASTFTGTATLSGGVTTLSGGATLGTTGALAVNQATLTLDNGTTATANRLGGRALTLSGATLNLLGNTAGITEGSVAGSLTVGSGATTINSVNAGGNNVLAFTTLAINTGGFINFTGGVGVSTNQITFSTAPTLSPVTTGILARATVNGADFATYGVNGIAAFTGYATPANVNSAAATDTLKVNGSTTTSNFTTNKTINALAFDTGASTVSNNFGNILTLTSGGILATNGAQTLSARTNLAGVEGAVHVGAGASLTISGVLTGTAGLNKNLTGALNINAAQFITGTHTLNGGTTTLGGGLNTLFPNQALTVNLGATLDLNGNSQYVGAFGGGNNPGTGGTITSSSAAVFSNNGSTTYGGAITGAITMNKTGSSTLTAESPLAYTGPTWVTGGILTLRDNATLLNTSAVNLNYGTLNLDSNANLALSNNNRLNDAAPITSRGGTLTYQARFATQGTETFGALSLTSGASTLNINAANNAGTNAPWLSTDVTFASLSRSAGTTVNITANQGFGNNGNANRVFFTTQPTTLANGMLGGWAIANTTDFAGYDPTLGVGAIGYGGFRGYDITFASGNITQFINNATPTVTSLSAATTTTSALRLGGVSQNDITFTSGTNTLVLESGGLLRSNQAAGSNIGTTASRGVLTAGTGSAAELVIYSTAVGTITSAATASTTSGSNVITSVPSTVGLAPGQTITTANLPTGTYIVSIDSPTQITVSQNATATSATNALVTGRDNVVVNSVIANNGSGAVSLVKSGAGVLNLSANNTYTGGTVINQGTVNLIGSGVVIPAGGLTLSGATLALNTNAGQIASTNVVTMNDSSTLTLVGANTLDSINFNNSGGTGTPTVTSGGLLTLTNSTPLSVISNNLATVPTVNGTVDFGTGAKTISVDAVKIGSTTLTTIAPSLTVAANILSAGASITKTGAGILQLSGANTFNGLTVSGGGVVVGASSTQNNNTITSGPLGVGSVSMASGTTLLTSGSFGVNNAISFGGTPTFDSTAITAWTLSLNGALSGAGLSGGTPTIQVNNPNLTVSLLGTLPAASNYTKTGPGTLIFNATNYTGNFNATALGNPTAISLINDGNGTGSVQTLSMGSVTFDAGIVPLITVNRGGGSLPFPAAANKILAPSSISNTGLGLTVTNSNGYGLKVSDATSFTATPTINVGTATASNVTQGLYMTGNLTGTGFIKTGAGTVVLNNAVPANNTFTGNININQGVVSVSSDAQLGNSANIIQLNPTTGTSAFRADGTFTLAHPLQLSNTANTRTIEVTGGNTLTLSSTFDLNAGAGNAATLAKNEQGTLILNANNPSWTGGININQGAVLINNSTLTSAAGTGTISISPGANVIGAALQLAGGVTVSNPLTLQGTNNLLNGGINFAGQLDNVSGTNTYSGPISHPFDATIGARAGSTLNITGVITASGTHRLQFNSEGDINITNTESGALFGFDKYGAGTLSISSALFGGTITTGGVKVEGGFLVLKGAGTTNSNGAVNLVYQGATMRLDNSAGSGGNTNNRLTGRALTLQGGTFDFISNSTTELAGALVADQGANTLNNGGSGTSSLTFASFTGNAGGTLNLTGTFGTSSNFVKFTTAPTLTPATTGILNRVTTNGNEFATYNTTNGIVPFTAYAAATNILSATATQTFKATTSTLNSLTSNATLNALNINNTAAVGGLGGNPPVTLTLTSGSIFASGSGGANLNVPIVAFAGNEGIIHVQSGQVLTVNSGMTGTGGLSKDLAGELDINNQQFVSGTHYINGGTLKLTTSGVTNPLLFNQAVAVNTGGTLDLNGNNQFIAGLSSASAAAGAGVAGGTVTNSAVGQSTFTVNGNTSFAGVVSGNIYFNKTGTGALNLQNAQTYTGATLITGGTVTLADNGALPNTSQPVDIRYASLSLSNGNLYNNNNRISDTAPITLTGASIVITGRQQGATTETMGAVTLAGGSSTLQTTTGGTNVNSLDVTIASLSRSDAASTIRFNATGTIGSVAHLFVTSAPTLSNNIIGNWAIVDREWASYDTTYGVGALNQTGFAGYTGGVLSPSNTGTDNIRFSTSGTTTLVGNTTVGTLNFATINANTVLNLGGNTLTVQGGGILFGQSSDTNDYSITNGSLTSGTLNNASDLFLHHANFGGTARTVTLSAPIVNNGTGAVRVILSSGQAESAGVGITNVNGVNTYTGGTVIQSGNIVLGATGQLGTGGLTVNNGTFTQTAGGVIPSQAWTLGGGSSVTLAGNNSLTNLTFNNNGGAAPTLNPTGILTLTGATGITATVSSPGTISTIAGGTLDLNANNSYAISVGAAIINGVHVAPWQAGLNITSNIQNGGIVKSGAGLLGLAGTGSTFTGGVNITAGGLVLGANSTPSTFSGTPFYQTDGVTPTGTPSTVVTSGPLGTGTLTLGANTTVAATTAVTVANNVVINGDVVFNGINNMSFNGLTTLPSTWNATVTAPQTTVSFADASGSQTTDVINKSGLGILSVGFYNGTINIAGGLQFILDGNTLGTRENINSGGNVALTSDTAISVNRSGASPNARNKNVQKGNLTNNGSIMAVNNQNGYGLEFTGTTTLTGASHFSVANATGSNVVQGLTLSGIVSDTGGFSLVKSGAGALALTNSGNTFGGVGAIIDILNGVVSASSDGALGNINNTVILDVDGSTGVGLRATGTFSTARTICLNQANNAIEVTAGNTLTVTNPFTFSALNNSLTKNDNGVLEISANNSVLTGAFTINAGAIRLSNSNAIGSGTLTINAGTGAALQLAGGSTYAGAITFNVGATGLNSRGAIESTSGINTMSGAITQGSGFGITLGASGASTLNISGGITTSNSTAFNVGSGSTINLGSTITGGGLGTNKIGTGVLNVTANQSAFTGALNVNQGTMNVSGSGITLGSSGAIGVNTTGTLNIDDSSGAASSHLGNRAVTVTGGTFTYTGNSANSSETSTGALGFGRGGSIYTSNQTGSGTVSLTFASLGLGSDTSVNFTGTNLGTATNKLLFTTAPTLTSNILARATVNGSTFATYGANGIAGFTAYNATSTTNINSAAATDTVDANAGMTTKNLTATKTINALRLSGSAAQTVGGAAFNQLTLTAGGVLATGGATHQLTVPVLNNAAVQDIFFADTSTTLNVSSTLLGSAGLVKDGDGTLVLASPASNIGITGVNSNTLSGTVNLSRGTLRLNGGNNTMLPGVAFVLGGPASTLDLNGTSQVVGAFLTDSSTPNSGGNIIGGAGSQLVINLSATDRSFTGSIGGSVNLVRSGPNTLTFQSPNTSTGVALINGGTTSLQSDGSFSGITAFDINYATLAADNNAATSLNDNTNRINDAATIALRGGTLSLTGRAQAASTETVGAVTLSQGGSFINATAGGTGINSADLTLTSLTRAVGGGTVNFTASGLIGSNGRVIVNTLNGTSTSTAYAGLTNGIIGGWATVGTSDFATYVPGLGVAALGTAGAPQYATATTLSNATGATDNVKLNTGTSTITLDTTVNSVATSNVAVGAINLSAGKTLTIASGGLLSFTTTSWNVGTVVGQGNITSGGSELFVYTQGSGIPTFNSVITGAGVTLVKTGSGTATLATTNTYGGGTIVNGGVLNVAATGTIPANGVTINNATLTLNAAGSIAASNVVTLNSAGSTLNLFGNNTLDGLVLNNIGGGSGDLRINTFSTATATGAGSTGVLTISNSGITVTSSNIASTATIFGRTDFGSTAKTINVAPINVNGVDVSPLQAAYAQYGIVGTTGGITKTGNGVLQFNAQAHYTGATTVNAGGIRTGVTNGGSRYSALTLNSASTYLNVAGATTTWGSLAGSGSVFNSSTTAATLVIGYDNTSTTFSGQFERFNDGAVNGLALQKIGTGTQTLTGVQAFATGTSGTITINGGTLRYLDSGEAFNGTALSGGGTFTLNNGGTLALDNTGASNVNSRLGLDVAGTLNIQGGKLTINGSSAASTTETITTFNVTNGGGRIELSPNASNALTLAISTLNTANANGTLVIGGITGAASAANVANVTIATPNLISGQGTGINGTVTMGIRHDILADASATGLGTGFLVKDTTTNNYRALASSELLSAIPLPLTADIDTVTAGNQAAGTANVGLTGATQALTVNSVANSLTISGTSTVNSGLGAAFGSYGPGGNLLTLSLSNAAASLTLAGATGTINTAFGSTTTGTTPFVHVVAGGTLNLNGAFAIGGTVGLAKADGGTLNLNNKAYYTGTTTINDGTVKLASGSANTIAVVPGTGAASASSISLNGTGAQLDLNGQNQTINVLASVNPLPGQGGTLTNTGAAAVVTSIGGGTFGGSISGALAFTRAGNSTTLLTNANTYTGATIVRGGNLQLRDSGSISSTAGLTLNYGTLNWDNFGLNPNGTPNLTRVAAANPITLQGGGITINGAGSTDTVVTLNSVTVTGGQNSIQTLPYINEGSTVKLTIGNLVRNATNHSGVNFNGFTTNNSTGSNTLGGQGLNTNSNIILTQVNGVAFSASNLVNNLIGGWAVADGSAFATYDNTFGVVAMGNTYGGFTAPAFTGTDVSAATVATGNYSDGTTARTLAAGAVVANSWRFGPAAAQTITFPTTTTATLGVGIITNAGFNTTLAATDATNTLSGAGTDLYFYVNQQTLIVNPAITGSAALVSNGGATLSLRPAFASNTYSGGTFVQAGTLNLSAGGAFTVIPGDLTVTNAAVTMSTQVNQIASTSNLFINAGGNVTLANYTTGPTQTLNSITFTNDGGTGNPSFSLGTPTTLTSTLVLSSATPITATNNSDATVPTISTGAATLTALQFSNANPVITVNAGLAQTGLTISAPITQNAGMTSLTKSGAGALALSGANTFTTGFNLNQGSLIIGASSTPTSGTVTSGPVGTGALTIAGGTSVLSSGGFTLANATTVNGDFTFGGVTATNNLTLSGAMTLGAAGRTLTVTSPAVTATISGVITSTATGTAITKAGAGTLVLSSAANSLNGAGVAVTGGILKDGVNNALPSSSAVTVSAGAGYDLNGFDQTTDTLTGPGFVTNSANSSKTLTLGGAATNITSTLDTTLTDNILSQATSRLNLTKVGTGTLTVQAANSHSGVTTVSGGILSISNSSALGTVTGGTTVASGASLELQGGITVGAEALTIAGTGSATNGALRNLSGNNVYGGTVTIGTGGATITSDAGLLTLNNATAAIAAATFPVTLNGAGNIAITTPITGTTATLTKTGAGTATLSGTNTYAVQTAINGGVLSITASANLGNASATNTLAINGGTLQTTGSLDLGTTRSLALGASGGTIDTAATTTVTLPAAITGAGGLTKIGAGTLQLNGTTANTFAGLTTISAGILDLNKTPNTNALVGDSASSKTTADVLINGGTLRLLANHQIDDSVYINMTSGTFNVNGKTDTIFWFTNSGGTYVSPRGSALTVTDPTWSGGTNDVFGNDTYGNLIISGGTNVVHGDETTGLGAGSLTVGAGGLEFQGSNNNLTLSSDNTTAGTLNLNGNVSFTGSAGTATITSGQALQSDGVTPAVSQPGSIAGTINLGSANRTFTIADGSAAIDMHVSAVIAGNANVGLIKAGAGRLRLSGANTYTGQTAVNAGVLSVGASNNLGDATAVTNTISLGGGTLESTGTFDAGSNRTVSVSGTTSAIAVTGSNTLTLSGAITGTGALAKQDTGTLLLTNANAVYSGDVTVNGGTLQVGNNSSLTATSGSGNMNVSSGAALAGTGTIGGSSSTTTIASLGVLKPGDQSVTGSAANSTLQIPGNLTTTSGGQIQLKLTQGTIVADSGFASALAAGTAANALDYYTNNPTLVTGWNTAQTAGAHNYDFINIAGTLTLNSGTIASPTINVISNGYTSQSVGDVFNLLDWGTVTLNSFSSSNNTTDLSLPTLNAGFTWDTTLFATTGILVVAPEPSRALLLLVGMMALFARRRRSN